MYVITRELAVQKNVLYKWICFFLFVCFLFTVMSRSFLLSSLNFSATLHDIYKCVCMYVCVYVKSLFTMYNDFVKSISFFFLLFFYLNVNFILNSLEVPVVIDMNGFTTEEIFDHYHIELLLLIYL